MFEICESRAFSIFLVPPRKRLVWTWDSGNGTHFRISGNSSTKSDCFVELVNVFVASLTIIANLSFILRYRYCENRMLRSVLLPVHTLRSLLCIATIVLLLLELSESLITSIPLPAILSVLAVISCWTLHRVTELRDGLGLAVSGAGFTVIAVSRIWRLSYLHRLGASMQHVRVFCSASTAACCGLLALVDSYGLYRTMQRNRQYSVQQMGNVRVSYRHGTAPFLSKLTFHWVVGLLRRGYRVPLDLQDLGELPEEESTRVQFEKFREIYAEEKKRCGYGKFSLWRCFWKRVWFTFTLGGILKLFGDATTLVGPMAVSKIIDYVTTVQHKIDGHNNSNAGEFVTFAQLLKNGYFLGFLVFLAAILQSTLSQASTHVLNVEGIHLRTALQALVYDKALRLCSWSISEEEKPPDKVKEKDSPRYQDTDIGTLTNLMTEDAYNVMSFFWIAHYIWAIPLKIAAIIGLLSLEMGVSAVVGAVCCLVMVIPLQWYLGRRMMSNSKATAERSDARLRLVNEVLQGIRLVKLRAWESLFENRVKRTRDEELRLLDKDSIYGVLMAFLTYASSVLTALFTFGLYFWVEKRQLEAGSVFTSLALFSQLMVPLYVIPFVLPIIFEVRVSTKRLKDFLLLPEIVDILPEGKNNSEESPSKTESTDKNDAEVGKVQSSSTFGALDDIDEEKDFHFHLLSGNDSSTDTEFERGSYDTVFEKESDNRESILEMNGVFSCSSEEHQLIVDELAIPRGKLTLIVGRTGSGKTSLLLAMLGEIYRVRGKVDWAGNTKVAYVSQKPWLLNATLRDNILFGSELRPRRYRNVLQACALQPDVDILPGRDLTRIGEKGINLSGGQKQRVTIARAIYSDADVVILDDPLSALDQQVGRQIFDQAIQRLLLERGRTVVMVTHKMELANVADQVVAMEGCRVRAVGSRTSIEEEDSKLAEEWQEAVKRQDDRHQPPRTAKDRWSLIRLVSRIGIAVRQRHASDGSWITDQDAHVTPPSFVPLRTRRSTLLGSRYLAHDLTDLPVPAEDWGEVRKRSRKHRNATRATSLQPPKRPPPVLRQSSTPTILDGHYVPPRKRHNTIDGGQQNSMLKQLFSGRLVSHNSEEATLTRERSVLQRLIFTSSIMTPQNQEWDPYPAKRLFSSDSEIADEADDDEEKNNQLQGRRCSFHEDNSDGVVTRKIWIYFIKAGGVGPGLTYVVAALISQFLRIYSDLWLSTWTEYGITPELSAERYGDTMFYLWGFIGISIGYMVLSVLHIASVQWAGARARRHLHQEAFAEILKAPLTFFERTPIGRILNRFSADMAIVDKKISTSILRLTSFILLCGSAILVNIVISCWFLLAAVPTCYVYYFLQKLYRKSARELQRLDGSTRGPVGAHFSETLAGLTTIRATKQQNRFMNEMVEKLNSNSNTFLLLNTSSRWLGIALDYLGATIVAVAVVVALISAKLNPDRVSPALVGLAINYTLLVPIYLNWVVKYVVDVEMYMGSVSRLSTYKETPKERLSSDFQVPPEWPKNGDVSFENVSLRYDPRSEPVIHNLNLQIHKGEKLGICGRTGSGKSSIAMALFRLVNIFQGRILIDGIDIKRVPLRTLRSRLSIIPQDVTMFSGTVRENLDPLSEHSDNEIWTALELAQMKNVISSYPEGLGFEVREGGENFSSGQLQLLTMARAALRHSTIIILDEATSALDAATEKSLLEAASSAFKGRTVISIAHRVTSLLDCDRVLVLEEGRVVEDGSPSELVRRPMGFFSAMLRGVEDCNEL
ncbi:ATP-binding cassette sub-family C member Sur [Orussus abietinus]|uniref:ATP-binding cassette sub-family C member Sur n=1 Tax=Orussus abietinus TaxID=222816 RepID=UPI000624FD34|nr:ATP-binding cassette sub-family C member Sur [Orussus abietinus]